MDKKKLNIVLIVAVSLIWGVLLFRFISPYFKQSDVVVTADMLVKKTIMVANKKDTVDLNFPLRDPFLEKSKPAPKKHTSRIAVKKKYSTNKVLKPISWPKVQYLGFVKSKTSTRRLGLIRINGVLHRVNKNEIIEGLKIILIEKDSILIANGKEKQYFKKI